MNYAIPDKGICCSTPKFKKERLINYETNSNFNYIKPIKEKPVEIIDHDGYMIRNNGTRVIGQSTTVPAENLAARKLTEITNNINRSTKHINNKEYKEYSQNKENKENTRHTNNIDELSHKVSKLLSSLR